MGVTVYFCSLLFLLNFLERRRHFPSKYSLKRIYKHTRGSHCAFYCETKQMCGLFCFGAGKRSQDGLIQGFSDILPENCWSQKTRPMFQIWHVHISWCRTCFLRVTHPSPQGRELFGAGWARWGNLLWQLQQMGAQEGDPTETLHLKPPSLAAALDFGGLSRWSVKLSDTEATGFETELGKLKLVWWRSAHCWDTSQP